MSFAEYANVYFLCAFWTKILSHIILFVNEKEKCTKQYNNSLTFLQSLVIIRFLQIKILLIASQHYTYIAKL